jgi:gliding motility-associated lipoprotein GldH
MTAIRSNKPIAIGFIGLTLLALLLTACNKNVVFSEYKTFKGSEWHSADKAVFEVDITDTLSFNNISLMVRHGDSYPYNNVFLFVTSSYPDGKVMKDTMEIVLASNKGEWMGSGVGDIFDFKVPVKKNVRFPRSGKYTFTFEQAMRVDPLPLVMDFGFEIEKVEGRK